MLDKKSDQEKRTSYIKRTGKPAASENTYSKLKIGSATRPLGIQVPFAAFFLAITITIIVGTTFYFESKRLIIKQENDDLTAMSHLVEPYLEQLYSQSYSDVLMLSRTPLIKEIVGISLEKNIAEYNIWEKRLSTIFTTMLEAKPHYTKIRFISAKNNGLELISIARQHNGIIPALQSQLQQKGHRDYVKESLKFRTGQVYFSKIELNREYGTFSIPHLPVLRTATPIYNNETGEVFGIVLISVNAAEFIQNLKDYINANLNFYLANEEGDYLSHIDNTKTFGFDLGERFQIQNEYPDVVPFMKQRRNTSYSFSITNMSGEKRPAKITRIDLTKLGATHGLYLLLSPNSNAQLLALDDLRNRSLLLGTSLSLIALGLSILFSRRVIHPLTAMSKAVHSYEETGQLVDLPINAKDELGVLARSFHNLVARFEDKSQQQVIAAKQAKEASLHIQAIFDSMVDAMIIIDNKGIVTAFNEAAVKLFGYQEEEVIGLNIKLLMPANHAKQHNEHLHKYEKTKQKSIIGTGRELIALKKDGTTFPIHLTISETEAEKGIIYTGIIRDISVQKHLENQREQALAEAKSSSKMKAEFLASMSHEIRTPMNGVLGMLDLLMRDHLSDKQLHYAKLALSSAEGLLVLINDILDFSKIEAGKLELETIDFNLNTLIGEATESLAIIAQNKGLELILDLTNINDSMVKGDPGRLRQILTNMINNAIKFTNHGEITIKCTLTFNGNENLTLMCSIADTGIGIPEEKISTLFDSFTQVDASTTRTFGGTGLGLAICKQLAVLMRGEINVTSKEGQGSCFTFSAELEESDEIPIKLPHANLHDVEILIVDDNNTNLEVLNGQLSTWGAHVTQAKNGQEALQHLSSCIEDESKNLFSVAILDMQMPNMNGATLGKIIRENKHFDSMHLIMMTSMSERGDGKYFSKLGFSAYFPKPTTPSDLYNALSIAMNDNRNVEQPLITHRHLKDFALPSDAPHILLVEDNVINQEVAIGALDALGFKAELASNGFEALNQLIHCPNENPYQLILMDCQMPEMDGYEATRQIRAGKALTKNTRIPIIAMTANAMKGDREKCIEAGMSDYLSKPINKADFKDKITKWLNVLHPAVFHSNEGIDEARNNDTQQNEDLLKEIKQSKSREDNIKLNNNNDVVNINDMLKAPLWDREDAIERSGNEKNLMQVIDVFIDLLPERVSDLQANINAQNLEKIASIAHEIKGVVSNISAIRLQLLTKTVEKLALQKNIEEITPFNSLITEQFNLLIEEIKAFRNQNNNQPLEIIRINDPDKMALLLKNLDQKLATSEYIDIDEVEALSPYLLIPSTQEKLPLLIQQISQFDTIGANATIQELVRLSKDVK